MAKKMKKYVPSIAEKINLRHPERYLLNFHTYKDARNVLAIIDQNNVQSWYVNDLVREIANGSVQHDNWIETYHRYRVRRILEMILPYAPEYKKLNEDFLAEFDSREDLQEIYREFCNERVYHYGADGKTYTSHDGSLQAAGYDKRPDSYAMFLGVTEYVSAAAQKIALAEDSTFMEGDIVKLRSSAINRRGVDPLKESRYANAPDSSVDRIGTVMEVTEKTGHVYRGTKSVGTRILKVLWVGKEEATPIEIKHLRWLERPTYKNGMKVRE